MKATENNIEIGTRLEVENHPEFGLWFVSKIKIFEGSKLIDVDKIDRSGGVIFDAHNWIIKA